MVIDAPEQINIPDKMHHTDGFKFIGRNLLRLVRMIADAISNRDITMFKKRPSLAVGRSNGPIAKVEVIICSKVLDKESIMLYIITQ